MKLRAVSRQVCVVRPVRAADAGIEIVDVLRERQLLNRAVEALAETVLARVEGEIDRRLRTVVVGLTRDERVRIGVAEKLAIFILRDEIRVFARDIRDAAAEFVERRYVVFKRDGRLFDVRRIDAQKRGSVVKRGEAEAERRRRHRVTFQIRAPSQSAGNK